MMKPFQSAAMALILSTAAHAVEAKLTPEKERRPAPPFSLRDSDGRAAKLSDYRGKVLLLNFWASWCGGCKQEMPWFQQLSDTHGPKRFAVAGLSMDEKPLPNPDGISYRILIADKAATDAYSVKALPITLLIDRKGRVAARYAGPVDKADLEANVAKLLRGR